MVGGLQKAQGSNFIKIDQAVSQLRGSKFAIFLIDLAIGLYKIVISQQIKEVIANGCEKLNRLMIAQIP